MCAQVLNTLMLSFVSMCIVAVMWVCWGYSFAFGAGNGFFGDLKFIGSVDVGLAPYRPYSTSGPPAG
jgi:Amt family ammonium transporter